jgi:flagellin
MTSILTNQSAITALQALRMTQQSLAATQKEISTGLKISTAADNASTWSIAQTMKSDQGVLSTISDSLNVSGSLLNVATAAVNNAITVLNNIKSAVAQAEDPSADQAKILTNLQALGKQLTSIVASASFNGQNLIDGSGPATYSIVASYTDGKGAAASSIGTIAFSSQALTNVGNTGLLQTAQATGSVAATDFTNLTTADLATATIADTLSNADKAIASLTSYAANIGATTSSVQAQNSFIKTLNDALTSGVSALVDADMNEASTKLQALQTQQQLGVQSLSIANQNSQVIMRLFQ